MVENYIQMLRQRIDEIQKRMAMDYELPPYDFIG
jgi:hypothetical protein